jgi:hypothetical protein
MTRPSPISTGAGAVEIRKVGVLRENDVVVDRWDLLHLLYGLSAPGTERDAAELEDVVTRVMAAMRALPPKAPIEVKAPRRQR